MKECNGHIERRSRNNGIKTGEVSFIFGFWFFVVNSSQFSQSISYIDWYLIVILKFVIELDCFP